MLCSVTSVLPSLPNIISLPWLQPVAPAALPSASPGPARVKINANPSCPCCWGCRKPFVHKVLHFQLKAAAQSPAREAVSSFLARVQTWATGVQGLSSSHHTELQGHSAVSSCWEQGSSSSLISALWTFQCLFTLCVLQTAPCISCLPALNAFSAFKCRAPFPRTREGEWDKGSQTPLRKFSALESSRKLGKGEKSQFSPCCPPTWPSRAERIPYRVGEECTAMKTNTVW